MSRSLLLLGMLTLVLAGCGTGQRRFSHTLRANYLATDAELRAMQFFVSEDVLVQAQAEGSTAGATALLVTGGTPGVVMDVGPNWLRISFREGGQGAVFLADKDAQPSLYYLAVEQGEGEFARLKDLPGDTFMQNGTRFKVVRGREAHLRMNGAQWDELVESRRIPGREE